ncbi:MAG: tol-pal system YbgF family protein [Salibacteraceae bacterium]
MNQDSQLIQRYYRFELSEEELAAFQKRLATDTEFSTLVAQYHQSQKTAHDFYQSAEDTDRQKRWEKSLENSPSHSLEQPKNIFSWQRIAASILFLIGVGMLPFLLSDHETHNLQDLLAEAKALQPQEEWSTLRGAPSDNLEQALMADAHALYQSEDYSAALQLLNKVNDTSAYYSEAILFTALCHFHQNDHTAFLSLTENLDANVSPVIEKRLLWYRGIVYLELGETEKARAIFKQLTDQDISMGSKGHQLLQRLKAIEK